MPPAQRVRIIRRPHHVAPDRRVAHPECSPQRTIAQHRIGARRFYYIRCVGQPVVDTREIRWEIRMSEPVGGYSTTYSLFDDAVSAQLRQEIYGEDIGQNSWLTAGEYRNWLPWLELTPAAHALEAACGSGGPALFLARTTGARVTGVDIDEHGVAQANRMAQKLGLADRARFQQADASQPLPFDDETFDAIVCVDAIN